MKSLRKTILGLSLISFFHCAYAQENAAPYEKPLKLIIPLKTSNYSIGLTFASYHEDDQARSTSNQVNPGLGVRYRFNEYYYLEGNHVFKNSRQGKTGTVSFGAEYGITRLRNVPVRGGLEIMHLNYEDPGNGERFIGYLPMLTISLGKLDGTVRVGYFPKPGGNGVWLFGYMSSF
jgi:hypothetical protein